MPRGERLSIPERIEKIDQQIAELQAKRKELLTKLEDDSLKEISDFIKSSGKTASEILQQLKEKPE